MKFNISMLLLFLLGIVLPSFMIVPHILLVLYSLLSILGFLTILLVKFGSPEAFNETVEKLNENGIGVAGKSIVALIYFIMCFSQGWMIIGTIIIFTQLTTLSMINKP